MAKRIEQKRSEAFDIAKARFLKTPDKFIQVFEKLLHESSFAYRDRIFSPLQTLWLFITQVLSADHSCEAALAHLIAIQSRQKQKTCSSSTGGYCRARARLPESFIQQAVQAVGEELQTSVPSS